MLSCVELESGTVQDPFKWLSWSFANSVAHYVPSRKIWEGLQQVFLMGTLMLSVIPFSLDQA